MFLPLEWDEQAGQADVGFKPHAAHAVAQLLQITLLGGCGAADDEAMYRQAAPLHAGDQFDKVFMSFQPGDAAGQRDQLFTLGVRELGKKCLLPRRVWLPAMWVGLAVDPAVNHLNTPGQGVGIFAQNVVAHGIGYGNDALTQRHDAAVTVDAIQAMNRCDKARARGRVHATPGQPGDPGRYPRACVDDVDLLFDEEFPQLADKSQRFKRLLADWPGEMFGAKFGQLGR